MNYTTYWSILDTLSHSIKSNIVCLIIAVCFGLLWTLTKKYKKDSGDGDKLILLWATGAFALFGTAMFFVLTFIYKDNSDEETLKMLASTTSPKIEGVVTNFQRTHRSGRYGGETIESFTVDSIQFAYGDALLGRFNSFSQTNNDVIHDGQNVRVTYKIGSSYGDNFNSILKLEIGK